MWSIPRRRWFAALGALALTVTASVFGAAPGALAYQAANAWSISGDRNAGTSTLPSGLTATMTLTGGAFVASLPVACLVTAILVVNDLRDIDEDRQVGKITPVGRYGAQFGFWLFVVLVVGAYASILGWVLLQPMLLPLLLVGLALPRAIATIHLIKAGGSRTTLNQALRGSAQLHLQFGMLLALGLIITRLLRPI